MANAKLSLLLWLYGSRSSAGSVLAMLTWLTKVSRPVAVSVMRAVR